MPVVVKVIFGPLFYAPVHFQHFDDVMPISRLFVHFRPKVLIPRITILRDNKQTSFHKRRSFFDLSYSDHKGRIVSSSSNMLLAAIPFRRNGSSAAVSCIRVTKEIMRDGEAFVNFEKLPSCTACRSYFTNGQSTKRDDPYAVLGLEWGDGATTAQIRQAFRERAKALHPDVVDTSIMSLENARKEFQKLVWAYEALLKHVQANVMDHESIEEWRVALWRQSDRIALDRTDVAGTLRKRPAPPAQTDSRRKVYGRELGHPSGKGIISRGEYLSDSSNSNRTRGKLRSSSVGRGQSKWVQPSIQREYKDWTPS
jgi:hypothetical protein